MRILNKNALVKLIARRRKIPEDQVRKAINAEYADIANYLHRSRANVASRR